MRWIVALAVMLPTLGMADRLVDIPLGRKLLQGAVRLRAGAPIGERAGGQFLLGTGVMDSYEVDIELSRSEGLPWRGTMDVGYNFSPPITDIAPGLSLGVLDVLDRTEPGRAGYVAFTQRFGNFGELNQNTPTEVTLGFWTRSSGLLFVGASLPLWDRFLILAEGSGENVVAGFEARPFTGFSLRWLAERPGQRVQATLQIRF